MLKVLRKSGVSKTAAIMLMIAMTLCAASSAQDMSQDDAWMSKIDAGLWEIMPEKGDDELIEVWLFLNDADHSVITQRLVNEKDMDPAVYEDEHRFADEIVPEVARVIEERVGYEEAHRSVVPESPAEGGASVVLDENGAYFDESISLVDRAISAKMDEYLINLEEDANPILFYYEFKE